MDAEHRTDARVLSGPLSLWHVSQTSCLPHKRTQPGIGGDGSRHGPRQTCNQMSHVLNFVVAETHGRRRRGLEQDESLSPLTPAWVRGLPRQVRPFELCMVYPRIANRIARSWDHVDLAESLFLELLVDHRGGRKGFPSAIAIEILRLHSFHEDRASRDGFCRSGEHRWQPFGRRGKQPV